MNNLSKYLILLHFTFISVMLLDIYFLRQIFGFIYVFFYPGFLLYNIFKIGLNDKIESIFYTVGISIFFNLFIGLLINELFPIFGIIRPLLFFPVFISYTVINSILLLVFIRFHKNEISTIKLNVLFNRYIIFFIIPIFTVIGIISQNNFFLSIVIIIICIIFFIFGFSKEQNNHVYILFLICIAISLIYHTSLVSKYLMGSDIHIEYYVFKITKDNSHWDPFLLNPRAYRHVLNYNS